MLYHDSRLHMKLQGDKLQIDLTGIKGFVTCCSAAVILPVFLQGCLIIEISYLTV